jgi:transcriptional regulator with PAS, ATPase and Fis domain
MRLDPDQSGGTARRHGRVDQELFSQDLIGSTPPMRRLFGLIEKIARTDGTVLISGESGTGKELVARSIHVLSARADRRFLPVNVAALPQTLVESELFGHVRGAFTGADRDRRGMIEEAAGGTLFLDEIGEMPPPAQAKLLRMLQFGEVRAVGSSDLRHVDVRIVAAMNRDPRMAIEDGTLREDLFYRLSIFHLVVPPLRERREDVPLLASYFLEKYSRRLGKRVFRIDQEAQIALIRHDYPGNVRELENALHRAVALADGSTVTLAELPPAIADRRLPALPGSAPTAVESEVSRPTDGRYALDWTLEEVERVHIQRVLDDVSGNVSLASQRLGISRTTLWRKMKRYDIASSRARRRTGDRGQAEGETSPRAGRDASAPTDSGPGTD